MNMQDRLLIVLKQQWITPVDALSLAGCLSLSQRCGEFRRAGVVVLDRWVDLPNGKRVKSYHVEAA